MSLVAARWLRGVVGGSCACRHSPTLDWIPYGENGCGSELTVDQRGVPRPMPAGGACDIGAYEAYLRVYLPLMLRNAP